MICAACKGSGIAPQPYFPSPVSVDGITVHHHAGTICKMCEGTGYRSNRLMRDRHESERDSIGKVVQYNPGQKLAKLTLEETVHVGSKLLIEDSVGETEFELNDILVSKMHMSMALAGWEVVILVPREVFPGTRIYRIGA